MARIGIDYGTTNTVVVASDRGHYSLVPHRTDTSAGPIFRDVFPSLAARDAETGKFIFGPDVERIMTRPGAGERYQIIGSLKRLIREYAEGVRVGRDRIPGGFDPQEVLTLFFQSLHESIRRAGHFGEDEPLEAVITWPANANGAQRHLTRQCFKRAGFRIIDTLNEPTASAIEFADRVCRGHQTRSRRLSMSVAVFDLGGGTFDASLVQVSGTDYTVLDSAGIDQLGGDDFDDVLVHLFARELKVDLGDLSPFQLTLLRMRARQQKECIAPGAHDTLVLNAAELGLPGGIATVPTATFFAAAHEILAPAVAKLKALLDGAAAQQAGVDTGTLEAIYLVGGSAKLPLVHTELSRTFPETKLVLSDKPFSSTAMGAALQSGVQLELHDILARTFGVLRLSDHGSKEYFSPIFPAGTPIPRREATALRKTVTYSPRHNIGHLRFLECSSMDEDGMPSEGVRYWSDALFPYDPGIPVEKRVIPEEVRERQDLGHTRVEETYTCDPDGVITVHLKREQDGQARVFEVFRN